jgi:hypothetical protein
VDAAALRRLALALPEVEDYAHGDLPAFRVRGKRFATMLDEHGVNLMLDQEGIQAAVACWPTACRPRLFGGRIAALRMDYPSMPEQAVRDLLDEAWARRAPRRLLASRAGESPPGAPHG